MTDILLVDAPAEGVRQLTLNRPEQLNAISKALETAFADALRAAAADDAVRAVVVAGAGERAFCAGYDVYEMSQWEPEHFRIEQMRQYWTWGEIADFPKPLVTANHALTLGWGAITSISADIRIAGPSTEFQFTASPHGGANLTWNLPQLVGWSKAKEYLMTSCRIGAEEALRSGLVNRVVPQERVLAEAIEVARQMASYPPSGVMGIKRLLREGMGRDQASQLRAEMEESQRLHIATGNSIEASYREWFAERARPAAGAKGAA